MTLICAIRFSNSIAVNVILTDSLKRILEKIQTLRTVSMGVLHYLENAAIVWLMFIQFSMVPVFSIVPTYISLVVSKTREDQFNMDSLLLYIPEQNISTFCEDMFYYNVINDIIYEKCLGVIDIINRFDFFHMVPDSGQYVNELLVFINEETNLHKMMSVVDRHAEMLFHDHTDRRFEVHGFGEWTEDKDDRSTEYFVYYKRELQISRRLQSLRAHPDPFRHCTSLAIEKHGAKQKVRSCNSLCCVYCVPCSSFT